MAADDDQGEPKLIEPWWVTKTLWLAPSPVIQVIVVAIITFISLMIFMCAGAAQSPVGLVLSSPFAALAIFFAAASVTRHLHRRWSGACDSQLRPEPERRPTHRLRSAHRP